MSLRLLYLIFGQLVSLLTLLGRTTSTNHGIGGFRPGYAWPPSRGVTAA